MVVRLVFLKSTRLLTILHGRLRQWKRLGFEAKDAFVSRAVFELPYMILHVLIHDGCSEST